MQLDTITCSDALAYLKTLPDDSVDCCVSSIPYFGLRDYGTAYWEGGDPECDHAEPHLATKKTPGDRQTENANRTTYKDRCARCGAVRVDEQIGLETTVQEFIAKIVEIYAEVWRVLKPTGTVWLNVGDSYANDEKWGGSTGGRHPAGLHGNTGIGRQKKRTGFKPKDKMLIPARIAIALQDAGRWVRSEIVWAKGNCMPSSAEDRPTDSHEMVYLLTKAPHYWSDFTAIREPAKAESYERLMRGNGDYSKMLAIPGQKPHSMHKARPNGAGYSVANKQDALGKRQYTGFNERWDNREEPLLTRNVRSVWHINPEPSNYQFCGACNSLFKGNGRKSCPVCRQKAWIDHFAAFPSRLVERCILAGCPHQVCSACGAPYERVIEKEFRPQPDVSLQRGMKNTGGLKPMEKSNGWSKFPRGSTAVRTLGWQPTCECNAGAEAGIVLDPFIGSGTTALVARRLGRRFIGSDLNPDYVRLCNARLGQAYTLPLFADL